MKKTIVAVCIAGVWINLSEFLRNELLFKQRWLDKYGELGLSFPSSPVNAVIWGTWSFLLAACIVVLSRKLSFTETFGLGWIMAFLMMWMVIWNLNVLPVGLLSIAVPWSLMEVALAVVIARRIMRAGADE